MNAGRASPRPLPNLVEPSRWPLVGRDDELALATVALVEHGSVVLTGAAGVGKTRLAHEVLARVASDGDRTEWVAATHSAATVPLGAVAHLVPVDALGRGRDSALRGIVGALQREQDDGRLLLGVDDAHLLDDASAALVPLLVRAGTASVVVTLRSDEAAPDAIVSLWKDGSAPLIALQSLARTEMESIVTTVLDGAVEGATLQFLWTSSGGNPLYLREVVLHGLESGALARAHGLWQWRGALAPGDRLNDLVAMRMGNLDRDERGALELVAVGQPLSIDCVRRLGIGDLAERLERRGLVASRRRNRVEVGLSHPLFGEVLRDRIPSTRRDEVQLQLADALEATCDGSAAELFRIALWRLDAGDRTQPDQFRVAARHALAFWQPAVAERLARAALEAGPEIEAAYILGEALSDQNRADEALDTLRAARQLPGPDTIRAAVAAGEAGVLSHQLGRFAEAELVLGETLEQINDPDARAIIEGGRAAMVASAGRSAGVAEQQLTGAAPTAVLAAVLDHTAAGRLELAVRIATERLSTTSQWIAEFPTIDLYLDLARTRALLLCGQVAEAQARADAAYEEAVVESADFPRAIWSLGRGIVFVVRGLPHRARLALREAASAFELADRGFLRPARAYLALAGALAGDIATGVRDDVAAEAASPALDGVFGIDVTRADAWLHAARGELSTAAEIAGRAAALARDRQHQMFEAVALYDVARFKPDRTVAARLAELARVVDGAFVDAMAVHARGLAADDGDLLDEAAHAFSTMPLDLFAAEASFAAARAHRHSGRRARAFAALDLARELAARCEGARTHAVTWAEQPEDLTLREREIADLAAGNLSSREIAERLGITTRTVDNLLGRVYAKLGISGRQELADLLTRRPSSEPSASRRSP